MMSYINETDFVIENKELVYPEIVTDGLQLYYDAKGKRDTDYHRDKMLDMSGNKNHGKLHNFTYEKHSGYKDGLVFDYIDDKLVRPTLNIPEDNFTFQLNGNVISFSPDGTVKRVQDGKVMERKGVNLVRNGTKNWTEHKGNLQDINGVIKVTMPEGATTYDFWYSAHQRIEGHRYFISMKTRADGDNIGKFIRGSDSRQQPIRAQILTNEWEPFYYINSNPYVGRTIYPFGSTADEFYIKEVQLIDLTATFGAGNEPTLAEIQAEPDKWQWLPNPLDLIEAEELKGNMLGDMENIIDGLYKTEVLSGEEIYTDEADDSVVHVEVDGKSYQHAGSGKNLVTEVLTGYYSYGGSGTTTVVRYNPNSKAKSYLIKVSEGETYIHSDNLEMLEAGGRWFFFENNPIENLSNEKSIAGQFNLQFPLNRIIEVPEAANWLYVVVASKNEYADMATNIQLEEGSLATEYEPPAPTPDYPIKIHSLNDFDVVSDVGGRNLVSNADKYNYKITDFTNVTFVDSFDMKELRNSKITLSLDINMSNVTSGNVYFELSLAFADGTADWYGVWYHVSDSGNFLGRISNTVTIPDKDIQRIRHFAIFDKTVGGETLLTKPKLEKGSKATPYSLAPEEITENDNHPLIDKINLLLDEPLRSVGDVKDRLFRDSDGVWKVERNVGELVFNGTENWKYLNTVTYPNLFLLDGINPGAKSGESTVSISTHYPHYRGDLNRGYDEHRFQGTVRNISQRLYVSHSKTTDLTEFKDFLSNESNEGNPLKVQYVLYSPTTETLPDEQQELLNNLRSFQDSNYVYTITDKTDDYVADNLKPTLHAKFLYNNWYKEDRVINNLMIYNRALANEEMLQNYKTIKRRWGM